MLVRSPFAGRLLLTVETDRVLQTRVIDMPASQVIVPVDVTEACRPNAYITATVVRPVEPELKWRTHRAFGVTRLNVDPSDHKLAVELDAPEEMRPDSPLEVVARVTDSSGRRVAGAAVTLAAVDEGILQLTNFKTPDPLGFFHAARALAVRTWDLYGRLMPEVARRSDTGGDDAVGEDLGERYRTPVSARRVKTVALFAGLIRTDETGEARAHFDVPPGFAGSLRVVAVTHAAERFGSAGRPVRVRSPLIVQSSLPRFVAPGDRFEATVAIFNHTPAAGEARVSVDIETPDLLSAGDGPAAVKIDAGGQAKVTVPLAAARAVGAARIRLTTTLGDERCEELIELPVRPAAPMLTTGGYAVATADAPTVIEPPTRMLAGTASLEVRLAPWPSLRLPEGLDYLDRYPYGCVEQTTSTCFPLVYLDELGRRIAPGMFEKERIAAKLQHGIYRLMGMQTADGGLAMWQGGRQSWPWASVYAAHMLIEARKAGHDVPADFLDSLLAYVRRQLDRSDDHGDALELQAHAAYVLALADRAPRAAMNRLTELAEAGNGAPDHAPQRAQAKLYLALAWMAAGREDLAARLVPPARAMPPVRVDRQTGGNISSPVRDRAMMVRALVEMRPDDPGLPALVQQLADSRPQWRSTQDCAFAVMAIGSYLKHLSTQPAEAYAAAELRLGGQVLAATADAGGTLVWHGDAAEPLRAIIAGGPQARGYVSWLRHGVPLEPPAAVDNGMRVRRVYADRDGKPIAGGRLRSGQVVRVELTIEAPRGTEHLVIEDLLPAGLEIENPRLATTASRGDHSGGGDAVEFTPATVDMRDDRLILVGPMPAADRARYVYLARAVTPGAYTLPPVRGECMYDIGMNSLHGAGELVVEPAGSSRVVTIDDVE